MPPLNIQAIDQVSSALSLASLRHQVIASNIAHREVPGHPRLKVGFAELLGADPPRPVVMRDEAAARPSLEQDMVALSNNALNYQALTRALSRYFSIVEIITGNNKG